LFGWGKMKIYLTVDCGPIRNGSDVIRLHQLKTPNTIIDVCDFSKVLFVGQGGVMYRSHLYANINKKRSMKWWVFENDY